MFSLGEWYRFPLNGGGSHALGVFYELKYLIIIILISVQLHWLGDKYFLRGPEGNDIHKTNVPNMRIAFRHEVSFETVCLVT